MTAYHFPEVTQLGDITQIDVYELEPVDIICAGSPCQDLSVAGKRKGLDGERSGLFRTAVDIVHELRNRTGKPRYFVWENVPGAFSSNKGMDFRAVLEEISQTEIPMPENNKWAEAGMVEWGGGSLAWRVLDAQYWGVPQRRKRIFLVADFGGQSAGEILFEPEGLRGHTSEGEGEGQEATGNAGKGVDSASWEAYQHHRAVHPINLQVATRHIALGRGTGFGVGSNGAPAYTLEAGHSHGVAIYGGAGQGTHNGAVFIPQKARCLTSRMDGSPCIDRGPEIIAAGFKAGAGKDAGNIGYEIEKAPTLLGGEGGAQKPTVAVYDMTHADEVMRPVSGDKSNCLNGRMWTGGNQVPVIHSYCIEGNTIDRQPQNGGNGTGNQEELSYTLNTVDRHAVAVDVRNLRETEEVSGTLQAKKTGGYSLNYQNPVRINNNFYTRQSISEFKETGTASALKARDYKAYTDVVTVNKSVRRLTPKECERLQGLPDGYTDIEYKGKSAPDSKRYKALGNGMAQPCADWVIKRIVEVGRDGENMR